MLLTVKECPVSVDPEQCHFSALHGALKARQSTSFPHPQVDWRTPSATRSTSCMKASDVAEGRHLGALGHKMRIAESLDGAKDVVPAAHTIGVENQEDMNYAGKSTAGVQKEDYAANATTELAAVN